MQNLYDKMEYCFVCGADELKVMASDPEWRIRYAAALAIEKRKDSAFLPILDGMLELENARPLYSQPVPEYIGVSGDTSLAELAQPFQVVFPVPADEDTLEAWKTRGRIKQAVLFAIYEIGLANEALIQKMHAYLEDGQEDSSVKAAAVRALGKVGNRSSLAYCDKVAQHFDGPIRMEAKKSLKALKQREGGIG